VSGNTILFRLNHNVAFQVLINDFNHCLSRANLSSRTLASASVSADTALSSDSGSRSETTQLSTICEAFCAAYADDDCLTLRMLNDFLRRICIGGSSHKNTADDGAEFVSMTQQVVLVTDSGDGK
jgi:hypothetical protein